MNMYMLCCEKNPNSIRFCLHINQYDLLLGSYFSNSNKYFPDIFIDKFGLYGSFHAPDFSRPICLAI